MRSATHLRSLTLRSNVDEFSLWFDGVVWKIENEPDLINVVESWMVEIVANAGSQEDQSFQVADFVR